MAENLRLGLDIVVNNQQLATASRDIVRRAKAMERAFTNINPGGLTKVQNALRISTGGLQEVEQASKAAEVGLTKLGNSAKLTATRFITYNIIARLFFSLAGAIRFATTTFIEFDSALNRARQILNPLTTDFTKFRRTIFDIGKEYGVAIEKVQEAQEVFIRQGKTQQEVTELTRASLALATAAAFDYGEATEALTSILNQFNISALQAAKVTDALVAVSINFAVTAQDVDQAIRRAGAAAETVGVKFEELVGFTTAAQEATRRGGRVIGTGLRTIFTRIFRAPSIEALEELGIQTRKTTGEFKSATSLLTELANKFDGLSETQRVAVASTIAGQRQIATLLAVLSNYKTVLEATDIAQRASGTAAQLTAIRQQALSVQIEKLLNQFKELGVNIADAISPDVVSFLKTLTDGFTTFGNAIAALGPSVLIPFASALTKLGIASVASTVGVGKLNDSIARRFSLTLGSGKKEVQSYTQSVEKLIQTEAQSRNRQSGGLLRTPKITEAVSAQREAIKAQNKLKQSQNALDAASFTLARRLTEVENNRINIKNELNQIQKIQNELKLEELQYTKALNKIEASSARIETQKQKLDLTKKQIDQEEKLIKNQERLVRVEKNRLRRTFGANIDNPDVQSTRRIELAKQTRKIEQGIALDKKRINDIQKQGIKTVQDELRYGEVRQRLEARIAARREKVNALRTVGGEQEVKAIERVLNAEAKLTKLQVTREERTTALRKIRIELLDLEVQKEQLINSTTDRQLERTAQIDRIHAKINEKMEAEKKLSSQVEVARRKILEAQRKVASQQEKTNTLLDAARAKIKDATNAVGGGKGGFAIGFGLSFLSEQIAQAFDDGEERATGFQRKLAEGFRGLGSILSSAFIFGTGPLGLLIIGFQAVQAIVKVFKADMFDIAKAAGEVSEQLRITAAQAQTSSQSFAAFSDVARSFEIGEVGLENFEALEKQLDELSKAFNNLSSNELEYFKVQIREAVNESNIEKLGELEDALRRASTIKRIESGKLLNPNDIQDAKNAVFEATEALQRLDETYEETLKRRGAFVADLQDIRETFGIGDTNKDEQLKKLEDAQKLLEGYEQQAVDTFKTLYDESLTFDQNLNKLSESTLDLLRESGKLNEAFGFVVRRQGVKEYTDSQKLVLAQTESEIRITDRLRETIAGESNQLIAATKAIGGFTEAQGRAIQFAASLTDELLTNSDSFEQTARQLASTADISEEAAGKILRNIIETGKGFTVTQLAGGKLALTIDGITKRFIEGEKGGSALITLLGRYSDVTGVAISKQQELNDILISQRLSLQVTAERMAATTSQMERMINSINRLNDGIKRSSQTENIIQSAFPQESLFETTDGLKRLFNRTVEATAGYSDFIAASENLKRINDEVAITFSDTLRTSIQDGGTQFEAYGAAISTAEFAISNIDNELKKLSASTEDLQERGLFGPLQREAANAARIQLQMERVASAALGLVSIRERLSSGGGGFTGDFGSEIRRLDELQNVLAGPGDALFNFKLIDVNAFDENDKRQLVERLSGILSELRTTVRDDIDPATREALVSFATGLTEQVDAAIRSGGDAATRTLFNALRDRTKRATDEVGKALDDLGKQFKSLEDLGVKTLRQISEDSISEIEDLGKQIRDADFLPDLSDASIVDKFRDTFKLAADASLIEIDRVGKELSQLKDDLEFTQRQRDALLGPSGDASRLSDEELEKFKALNRREQELVSSIGDREIELSQKTRDLRVLEAQGSQLVASALTRVSSSYTELTNKAQDLIQSELQLASLRVEFADIDSSNLDARIALAQQERVEIERIFEELSGLKSVDLEPLAQELKSLLIERLREGGDDPAIDRARDLRIQKLQIALQLGEQLEQKRVESLRNELQIIQQQAQAIQNLGLSFVQANREQQEQAIKGSRLVQKFFGNLSSEAINSPAFKDTLVNFLTSTTAETRQAVFGQLSQLKEAGGLVAPGVTAGELLDKIGQTIGGALFTSPQQAVLERQEGIQQEILNVQIKQLELDRAAAEAAAGQFQGTVDLFTDLLEAFDDAKISQRTRERAGVGGIAGAQSIGELKNVIKTQREQEAQQKKQAQATKQATISNDYFVEAMKNVDLTTSDGGQSLEEFQNKMVDLRNQLLTADESLGSAEDAFRNALGTVGDSVIQLTRAQADFNLGVAQSERATLNAVGGFQTFESEIAFLTEVYNQQIKSLREVGAGERELSQLRSQLAQEQLTILEQQINQFESAARSLLSASPQDFQNLIEGAAGAFSTADFARTLGIDPGDFQQGGVTQTQFDELLQRFLAQSQQTRENIISALEQAPPGQTFGGFSPQELLQVLTAAAGGGNDVVPTLQELEQRAAEQRAIIAQNSLDQLFTARDQLNTSLSQLATAQEQLNEAKAQKELIQLKLEDLQGTVISSADRITSAIISSVRAGSNSQLGLNAAGGTLTPLEMRGLFNAAEREKRAMPANSRLGVFNTSETVLTNKQASQLRRVRGGRTVNAQDGFGAATLDGRVITLLSDINTKLASLATRGVVQEVDVTITSDRRINVQGIAELQTQLQNIISDRTQDLFTREEAEAIKQSLNVVLTRMRQTGQISAIGT